MDPGPGVYNLKMGIGGSPNYFLLKLKSNGDFVWGGLVGNNSYGGSGVERVDIALDKEGNIFMTAPFGDSSDFDPDTLNVFMLNTTGGRAVSYTHLDVYKRQELIVFITPSHQNICMQRRIP